MGATTVPREKSTARKATDGTAPTWKPELHEVPLDAIDVGINVRTDVAGVDELAASIRSVGVLSPIRVEEAGAGRYALVYGQRRLAAAREAGLATIPALVDANNRTGTVLVVAQLVENLQRHDLNPLEEAAAFRQLLDAEPKLTQAALATQVGRSAPYVSNALRLLKLGDPIKEAIRDGRLSGTAGRAVASLPPAEATELARRAEQEKLSTHQLEEEVRLAQARAQNAEREAAARRAEERKVAALADQAETLLADAGAVKETAILASNGYYAAELIKALGKRGWTAHKGYGHNRGDECDCLAFMPDLTWNGKLERLMSTCVSDEHDAARKARENEAWQAKQAAAAEAEKVAAAERRQLAKPLEAYLAGDDFPFRRRLTLLALVGNGYQRANAFLSRHNPKHQYEYGGTWGPKVWGAITRLDDAKVASELSRLMVSTVLEEMNSAPLRQALAKHVPGVKEAAAKPARAKKAAATS